MENRTIQPIRILPEFIANQIAAGQVVSRPESVVKELVENSLDAGSDTVMVVIKDAGKQLIYVVDNGKGMSRSDLSIALKRHSTSKIFTSEDLEAINTFGFRGEALASIASVAGIEIRTFRVNEPNAWKLTSEPMGEPKIEPCSLDVGSQIFVRNLFYNIPARKKFLHSNLTEFRYISETMVRFALAKPNIRFIFYDDTTLVFDAKKSSLLDKIKQVVGREAAENAIPLEYSESGIKISGYIGTPSIAGKTRANQYIFLNGRYIQNKSVNFAAFTAYEHLLEKALHPFYVLNISMDAAEYDINVHPLKYEVKFDDEKKVFNAVNKAVTAALSKSNFVSDAVESLVNAVSPFERVVVPQTKKSNSEDVFLVNKSTGEIVNRRSDNPAPEPVQNTRGNSGGFSNSFRYNDIPKEPLFYNADTLKPNLSMQKEETPTSEVSKNSLDVLRPFAENASGIRFFQLHCKYLLFEVPSGMLILDQHAAHERVLYEKILANMNSSQHKSQQLLFPEEYTLSPAVIAAIKEIASEINSMGYIFTTDDCKVSVSAVPPDDAFGSGSEIAFSEVINQYIEESRVRIASRRENLAASFACKAAIKTGKILSREEIVDLVKALLACDMPQCCPHGRPTSIIFPLTKFDKIFGRIF